MGVPEDDMNQETIEHIVQLLDYAGWCAETRRRSGLFATWTKEPNNFVTDVDRNLHELLRAGIQNAFPNDAIVSEEDEPTHHQTIAQSLISNPSQRCWFIDPLDGSDNFINPNDAQYSIHVGFVVNAEPVFGWVGVPSRQVVYFGGPNFGVFKKAYGQAPQPLKNLRPQQSSAPVRVLMGHRDPFRQKVEQAFGGGIQFVKRGSAGLKVMAIIENEADVYLHFACKLNFWDTAAPVAIAKATGLMVCDVDGCSLNFVPDSGQDHPFRHRQPVIVGAPDVVQSMLSQLRQLIQSSS